MAGGWAALDTAQYTSPLEDSRVHSLPYTHELCNACVHDQCMRLLQPQ